MLKMKKILLALLLVVTFLGAFALMGFATDTDAYADGNTYFTDEEYTESDYLLNSDGTESTKNIQTFANDVKSALAGTSFPELLQVIPRQYLEATDVNATFTYNGKEYGFYVVKQNSYFDVLLIDFVYEFEDGKIHSDIEYSGYATSLMKRERR